MSSIAEETAKNIADEFTNTIVSGAIELNYVLSEEEMLDIADKVFDFCIVATGVSLFPYQKEFGLRIIQSLLLEDGEEITALFARQSGKTETVACVVVGCLVLLPILAKIPELAVDTRISKFKDGLWVGIFAPTHELGGIMHQRMALRMASGTMEKVLADPEVNLALGKGRQMLHLPNGSYVDSSSASPQARIEGKTYHLILCFDYDTIIHTQIGPQKIGYLAEKHYRGKILALDHGTGSLVWAKVEGDLELEPIEVGCYEVTFSNDEKVTVTEDHLWWVEDVGYVATGDLYARSTSKSLRGRNTLGRRMPLLLGEVCEPEIRGDTYSQSPALRGFKDGRAKKSGLQGSFVDTRECRFRSRKDGLPLQHGCRSEVVACDGVVLQRHSEKGVKRDHRSDVPRGPRMVVDGRRGGVGEDEELRLSLDERLSRRVGVERTDALSEESRGRDRLDEGQEDFASERLLSQDQGPGTVCFERPSPSVYTSRDGLQAHPDSPDALRNLPQNIHTEAEITSGLEFPLLLTGVSKADVATSTKIGIFIREIRRVDPPRKVYDLKTSTGNFFANGVLSHNCEETQDINNTQLRKSIHPMAAATSGTLVKIGTPNRNRNDFYDACHRGIIKAQGQAPDELKTHFQYDYTEAAKYNPRYAKYIEREIERLGYDSEEFKQSYRLHWLVEHGMFATPQLIKECGIRNKDTLKVPDPSRRNAFLYFSRSEGVSNADRHTENLVASIDIGRHADSTIVTIAKVWWENPINQGYGSPRFYKHIVNWMELQGDDHEVQYPKIMKFLKNFNLGTVIIDATGRGDPIYERIKANLDPDGQLGITVIPFVFTTQSKHLAYTIFGEELKAHRLTYPDGRGARKLAKTRRFKQQMSDLEKSWRGKYMVVEARTAGRAHTADKPHDDYPDSAAMLCWFVDTQGNREVETRGNPLFDMVDRRVARRERNSGVQKWGGGGARNRNTRKR
jgi:hypothetical protein